MNDAWWWVVSRTNRHSAATATRNHGLVSPSSMLVSPRHLRSDSAISLYDSTSSRIAPPYGGLLCPVVECLEEECCQS